MSGSNEAVPTVAKLVAWADPLLPSATGTNPPPLLPLAAWTNSRLLPSCRCQCYVIILLPTLRNHACVQVHGAACHRPLKRRAYDAAAALSAPGPLPHPLLLPNSYPFLLPFPNGYPFLLPLPNCNS
eukprot:298286-Chlamydomonas_euryale.AAC.1